MNRFIKKMTAVLLMMTMIFSCMSSLTGCLGEDEDVIVLRVSNWEEYIDEGGWEDEEIIDLDENTEIFSKNSMIEEYEEWKNEFYNAGQKFSIHILRFLLWRRHSFRHDLFFEQFSLVSFVTVRPDFPAESQVKKF